MEKFILDNSALTQYGNGGGLADKMKALLNQQKDTWELLCKNYEALKNVKRKTFGFDWFNLIVQFNPGRITSSSAKVDEDTINNRKCFLCPENLPDNQKGLSFFGNYYILCNPYPIFHEHFTIPQPEHKPQSIRNNFDSFLDMSKELGKFYFVFYNGPKCGASAPDHMHFQAGNTDFLPVYSEYEKIKKNGTRIFKDKKLEIFGAENYLRNAIVIESNDKIELASAFSIIYSKAANILHSGGEPMMNIVSFYDEQWKVIIFLRRQHRPRQFFETGERRILFSPAAVDLGGVLILPREEDFKKITQKDAVDMLRQVIISKEYYEYLKVSLWRKFNQAFNR